MRILFFSFFLLALHSPLLHSIVLEPGLIAQACSAQGPSGKCDVSNYCITSGVQNSDNHPVDSHHTTEKKWHTRSIIVPEATFEEFQTFWLSVDEAWKEGKIGTLKYYPYFTVYTPNPNFVKHLNKALTKSDTSNRRFNKERFHDWNTYTTKKAAVEDNEVAWGTIAYCNQYHVEGGPDFVMIKALKKGQTQIHLIPRATSPDTTPVEKPLSVTVGQ